MENMAAKPNVRVDIFNLVTPGEVVSYYNGQYKQPIEGGGALTVQGGMPFLGEMLFEDEQQRGLKMEWIKGAGGLPVALKASAFDANVTHRGRTKAEKFETEMPFFKEASKLNETDRQELGTLIDLSNANANYAIQLNSRLKSIFDGFAGLIMGGAVTREYMKMDVLSTGKIEVSADGVLHEYDFLLEDNQQESLAGAKKWDQKDTATPIADLIRWKKEMQMKGKMVTKAIMNSVTFELMKATEEVQNMFTVSVNGVLVKTAVISDNELQAYIMSKAGIEIYIYDKVGKIDKNTEKKYWPDHVVTLIPDGKLGKMKFGTTPEQYDLMRSAIADVGIVDTGVAVTVTRITDPVNVELKVSQICLPSAERLDSIFIATVS